MRQVAVLRCAADCIRVAVECFFEACVCFLICWFDWMLVVTISVVLVFKFVFIYRYLLPVAIAPLTRLSICLGCAILVAFNLFFRLQAVGGCAAGQYYLGTACVSVPAGEPIHK